MECDAKELARVLARARDFLGSSITNPAFKCFRFEGRFVEAADFDLSCRLHLPEGLEFKEPVLVPGAEFQAIAAKLSERVTITVDTKAVKLSDGSSKFLLATMASGGFPAFPREPEKYVSAPLICQAVKAVKAFAGDPKRSQIYASVRIDDDLVVSGDEKFRALCVAQLPTKTGITAIMGLGFAGLFSEEEETELGTDGRRMFLRSKAGVMCGPTVEGRYADYRKATASYPLPQCFIFKHKDLKEAVDKIAVLAKDGDITLAKFQAGGGRLVLEASMGVNHAVAEVATEGDGKGEFYLNLQLVSSWIRSAKCDRVSMYCDTGQPRVVKFSGDAELPDGRTLGLTVFVCPMIPPATGTKT